MEIPVISFVGAANSGKTTYLERLTAELKRRGYKLAVIKHDVHGFEIDIPGKDTWRHAQAGADVVCISSRHKMALIRKVEQEMTLAEIAGSIDGVDVILTEGYKGQGTFKVEVFRQAAGTGPVCSASELAAIVTDADVYGGLPRFGLDDAGPMADFLETNIIRRIKGMVP